MLGNRTDASDLFRELSAILTGDEAVAGPTADRHLATLQQHLGEAKVVLVLDRFASLMVTGGDMVTEVQHKLIDDPALGPVTKAMVLIWFTGVPDPSPGAPGPVSQSDFFEALMWTSLGAHPPAYSDGYYGHWRYPPDTGY